MCIKFGVDMQPHSIHPQIDVGCWTLHMEAL